MTRLDSERDHLKNFCYSFLLVHLVKYLLKYSVPEEIIVLESWMICFVNVLVMFWISAVRLPIAQSRQPFHAGQCRQRAAVKQIQSTTVPWCVWCHGTFYIFSKQVFLDRLLPFGNELFFSLAYGINWNMPIFHPIKMCTLVPTLENTDFLDNRKRPTEKISCVCCPCTFWK